MRCPFCKQNRDKVIDSRESTDAFVIRRRRECVDCGRRFTTRERIEETPLRVEKRDGSREDFERRKILVGLITACQKRPVSTEDLELITQKVEDEVFESLDREVSTEEIGNLVMHELKRLDKVAYVRFASVYKSFESPGDFADIAQEVGRKTPSSRRRAPRRKPAADARAGVDGKEAGGAGADGTSADGTSVDGSDAEGSAG